MSVPDDLRSLYHEGRVVPFVGAGASMAVRWSTDGRERGGPSWTELVDEAARQLGCADPDLLRVRGTDLQILEYYRLRKRTLAPLTNWFAGTMRPPDDALRASRIHAELAALTRCSVFYTTNFDDFLERSFRLRGRPAAVINIEAHMGQADAACEIVKFHGDWDYPDQMVLSESDYERRLSFTTPLDHRLRADLLGRAILFLGYSFRDQNVTYLFRLVNEQLSSLPSSPSGRRAYIVVAEPSDFERRLYRDRNIDVIGVSGSTTSDDVAELLREMRS